ncbi:Hypothetical protein PHPALM_6286 [Phytophthora palmivora]|uniref:Uncharacterized protein n=1 Tax=Phytophthora palmivora TaxID=4796 RepID=A0A2P4YF69_9STRA|nr:Hypothetical protein PHPALM_6286 [Phytophthora palmivora]
MAERAPVLTNLPKLTGKKGRGRARMHYPGSTGRPLKAGLGLAPKLAIDAENGEVHMGDFP